MKTIIKQEEVEIKNDNAQINMKSQSSTSLKDGKNKKDLTPYQKYKQSKNKNGKKYFDFYDDIKVYTHNIYDW